MMSVCCRFCGNLNRIWYSINVCGMNKSTLTVNFSALPASQARNIPAMRRALLFLENVVESIAEICLCRGWVRSLFLCRGLGSCWGTASHFLWAANTVFCIICYFSGTCSVNCIPGELSTSGPPGGPEFTFEEVHGWSFSYSMRTWLASWLTPRPSFEFWDCWEGLGWMKNIFFNGEGDFPCPRVQWFMRRKWFNPRCDSFLVYWERTKKPMRHGHLKGHENGHGSESQERPVPSAAISCLHDPGKPQQRLQFFCMTSRLTSLPLRSS